MTAIAQSAPQHRPEGKGHGTVNQQGVQTAYHPASPLILLCRSSCFSPAAAALYPAINQSQVSSEHLSGGKSRDILANERRSRRRFRALHAPCARRRLRSKSITLTASFRPAATSFTPMAPSLTPSNILCALR